VALRGRLSRIPDRIAAAVSAIRGPSRLVLTYAGDVCTRSELVLDVGSAEEHRDGISSEHVIKQLTWRLRGRQLRRETREFDRIEDCARPRAVSPPAGLSTAER
jgi:hypothetical protein